MPYWTIMTDPLRGRSLTRPVKSLDDMRRRIARVEANRSEWDADYFIDALGNGIVDGRTWCLTHVKNKATLPRMPAGLCCGWRRHADRNLDPVIKRFYAKQCDKLRAKAGYRDDYDPNADDGASLDSLPEVTEAASSNPSKEVQMSKSTKTTTRKSATSKKAAAKKTAAAKKPAAKKTAKPAAAKEAKAKPAKAKSGDASTKDAAATNNGKTKVCARCETRTALELFISLTRSPDGLGRFCPDCREERRAERAARTGRISVKTKAQPTAGKVARRPRGGGKKVPKTPRRSRR